MEEARDFAESKRRWRALWSVSSSMAYAPNPPSVSRDLARMDDWNVSVMTTIGSKAQGSDKTVFGVMACSKKGLQSFQFGDCVFSLAGSTWWIRSFQSLAPYLLRKLGKDGDS